MIQELDQYFEKGFLQFVILLVVSAASCYLLDRFSRRKIDHYNLRFAKEVANNQYLRNSVRFLIWFIGALIVFRQIKPLRDLGDTVLGATSVIAVMVGIAAQATFSNYIAGFFLAIHHPFKVGDVIHLKEKQIAGTVKEITFRHTVIETKTGSIITIPNSIVNSVMIEDLSSFGYSRPVEIKVSLKTDPNQLQEIIADILSEEGILKDKDSFHIMIDGFDGKGYSISFPLDAQNLQEYVSRRTLILPKLNKKLQENGIEVE